jgi:hypothetical protein
MDKEDNFDPNKQIAIVYATLNQPDKFAEVFCKAAESQKSIDNALQIIIRNLIQKDRPTRDSIKALIKEYEKEEWWVMIRKGFSIGWTLFAGIIGAIIYYWLQ